MNAPGCTVLQIGAREHYAVARALHRRAALHQLLTDAWGPRLWGRYHPDLATARVVAPTQRRLALELRDRLSPAPAGWTRTMARNAWFQRWACRRLAATSRPPRAVFAYSYAAASVLQLAAERGWFRVLGQIDPGPEEERLVIEEHRRFPQLVSAWQPAPPAYWQAWRRELELADRIVVNSVWSEHCLRRQGVPPGKLRLIPLAYEPQAGPAERPRPAQPRSAGPFQLLFLGTVGLRKGIARLLEAMRILETQPVQLTLAGPSELDPLAWADRANIRWLGPVRRTAVAALYRQADAMILPTLSDGFAITQLEALACACPVIASQRCGAVVSPGVNGWILPSLEPEAIAATIREAMHTAAALPRPLASPPTGLDALGAELMALLENP